MLSQNVREIFFGISRKIFFGYDSGVQNYDGAALHIKQEKQTLGNRYAPSPV